MRQILKEVWINRKMFTMLVVGFLFTILPMQIALSTQSYFDDLYYDSINGHFRYYYTLELTNLTEPKLDELQRIADTTLINSSVVTNEFSVKDTEHGRIIITGLLNHKIWSPPLLEGTGITSDGSNRIIVGKIISSHMEKINILGREYNVEGIAGRSLSDAYNLKVFMNLKSIPDSITKEIIRKKTLQIMVRSNQNPNNEISLFTSEISKLDGDVKINIRNESKAIKQAKNSSGMVKEIQSYPYQLLMIALVNCIIVSYLWIYLKRKDMAIRIVMGASPSNLVINIIFQLFLCAMIATIGSNCIQWLLGYSNSTIFTSTGYFISTSPGQIIVACLATIVIALITSLVPLLHVFHIEPAKALKE
ncbi:MAG: ABC transporter permease [Paenibacillaceae bacterium]|uniref:FtsX-like permease family protein n=1 Tax=uncultured Paenibacillus sp. TaxID=227322 RepID=UPI0015AC679D|nr:ABC transporter permease [uncultured Paenibacillus sp.]MBW4839922.1 ABC transporter permease [Paenibacillaceae bacterium]